jgi:hypothetical protein
MLFILQINPVEAISLDHEQRNFLPSNENVMINDVIPDPTLYGSLGYVSLTMGYGNKFDFDVTALLDGFIYYESNLDNIDEIYIIVQLGTYYTTAENGYWNTSVDSNISFLSTNVLKYQLDPNNIDDVVTFSIWWANLGYSGGAPYTDTGGLRFYGAYLTVSYIEPVDTVNYVHSDYDLLPDSHYSFIRIRDIELFDPGSNSYHVNFDLIEAYSSVRTYYQFDVSIPSNVDMSQVVLPDGKINMSYSTTESGDRVLYIQPNPDLPPYPNNISVVDDIRQYMVGFTAINLSTLEFQTINKLNINALVNKEDNSNAYAYLVFNNFLPDDLYTITLEYSYRYKYMFSTGDWQTSIKTYAQGSSYDAKPPAWLWFIPVIGWNILIANEIENMTIFDIDEVILPIDINDMPADVIDRYETDLSGNRFMLETLPLYKVHLGQFREPLTTEHSMSVGYDISSISILSLIYSENGVAYSVPYELIDQENTVPDVEDPWYEDIVPPNLVDSLNTTLGLILASLSVGGVIALFIFISIKVKQSKSLQSAYKKSSRKKH